MSTNAESTEPICYWGVECPRLSFYELIILTSSLVKDGETIRQLMSSLGFALFVAFLVIWIIKWSRRQSIHIKQKQNGPLSVDIQSALKRKEDFLQRNGNVYGYQKTPGGYIDEWRPIQFPNLISPLEQQQQQQQQPKNVSDEAEIYLDYAGTALPTQSQLDAIYKKSTKTILANPHSTGPAASRSLLGIQEAKKRILNHFDATPGRFASLQQHPPSFATPAQCHSGYDVAFTSGTTEGLRLVAERFPWKEQCPQCQRQSVFLYTQNSHTSVVGMRILATNKGARFECRTLTELQAMTPDDFDQLVGGSRTGGNCSQCNCNDGDYRHLLALPAECNFGGTAPDVKAIVHTMQNCHSQWHCLVDIAKAASTGPVSLREINADFAVLSFYKLFGEPTGLGALLVKQTSTKLLLGSGHYYQGGGSVDIMLPHRDVCIPRSEGLASLANGSVHFRGILAICHGFDELERRGGMHRIHEHATCLARELSQRLEALRHGNGQPVIALSGAWANPALRDTAGPTVVLNVLRDDGSFVGYNEVSKLASLHHPPIQFRTGCFCNPGACQEALKLSESKALENYEQAGHVCGDHIDLVNGKPTGAIRISFGKDSLWEDMDTFIRFLQNSFVNYATPSTIVPAQLNSTSVTLTEIYLFPIKSCAGQQVHRWKIQLPSGKLAHDREFALVDTSGTAIRLQTCPKMTTIQPKIDLDKNTMTLSAPGKEDLVVQLSDDSQYHCSETAVKVCGNKCGGRLWGDHEVSEWFSSYLGVQCWLARFADGKYQIPQQPAPERRAGFANEQALLLISENAVGVLNQVLQERNQRPVGSRHFRPNLVVQGMQNSHIEDEWKLLTSYSGLQFEVKGSCARCAMVDFDPYTGAKGKTLRALANYRRKNGQITFGVFLKALGTEGERWIEEGELLMCS